MRLEIEFRYIMFPLINLEMFLQIKDSQTMRNKIIWS